MNGKDNDQSVHILLVEDNPGDVRLAEEALGEAGLCARVTVARSGREALDLLERAGRCLPDVVLTDLRMPEMTGLDLVEAVRAEYPVVPVILMTAYGNEEIALAALQRGAASYVPKKDLLRDLGETVTQVLDASRTRRNQERVLSCLVHSEEHFVLENDFTLIPPLASHLQETLRRMKLCDETGLIRVMVALSEALANAMRHGNLEVGSPEGEEEDRAYFKLAERRQEESPYRERRVYVIARHTPAEAVYRVRDDGPGFDPNTLPDPTDPANLEKISGRGLLLIRNFMHQVSHNAKGNEITMVLRRQA